jgi:hypothetical protein
MLGASVLADNLFFVALRGFEGNGTSVVASTSLAGATKAGW